MKQTIAEVTKERCLPKNLTTWVKENNKVNRQYYIKPKTLTISTARTINWQNRAVYKNIDWDQVLVKLRSIYKFKFIADLLDIDEVTARQMISGIAKNKIK